MKKTAIIISALILAVVMAGCSGTQTNSTALSAPSVNTELLKDYVTETAFIGSASKYVSGKGSFRSVKAVTLFFTVRGTLTNFGESYYGTVTKGQTLTSLQESDQYLLECEKKEQALKLHQTELDRLKAMSEGNGEVALQRYSWEQKQALYESLKAGGNADAAAVERARMDAEYAKAEFEVAQTKAANDYTDALAEHELLKLDVEKAKAEYEACFLKAPMSGKITWRTSKGYGETVEAYEQILTIESSDDLTLLYMGSLNDSQYLDVGTVVTVTISQKQYRGQVLYTPSAPLSNVNYALRSERGQVYPYFIRLDGFDYSTVQIGTAVPSNVSLLVGHCEDAVLIHSYLVETSTADDGTTESYVYLYVSGTPVKRVVKTGLDNLEYTEILAGLQEGDEVIYTP